jgi:hypothetical protein
MVADPGPGVPIPTLTWAYVAAAVAFPAAREVRASAGVRVMRW